MRTVTASLCHLLLQPSVASDDFGALPKSASAYVAPLWGLTLRVAVATNSKSSFARGIRSMHVSVFHNTSNRSWVNGLTNGVLVEQCLILCGTLPMHCIVIEGI